MLKYCSYNYLKKYIICYYGYWDGPLSAYLKVGNKMYYASCSYEDNKRNRTYSLIKLNWNPKYQEWLDDYKAFYLHCFYTNGTTSRYDGRPLKAFTDKYNVWHPAKDYI